MLVVEGEKAADAAAARFSDYVVITSSGGANAARRTDWGELSDRKVTIWPDADVAGARYADDVAAMARTAGAASVRTVALPAGLPEGWDLADDLPPGLTDAELDALLAEAGRAAISSPLPLFPPLARAERFPIEALGPVLPVRRPRSPEKSRCPRP